MGCLCLWIFLDVYGCLWMFMDVYGCLWMFMDVYGCLWHGRYSKQPPKKCPKVCPDGLFMILPPYIFPVSQL